MRQGVSRRLGTCREAIWLPGVQVARDGACRAYGWRGGSLALAGVFGYCDSHRIVARFVYGIGAVALTTHPSLLQRVKDPKDGKSWREFFGIYEPLLCQYARRRGLDREMAEEVAQQCMASLVEKMPGFEYSRERGGFKLWLQRVANNKINDYFKKKKLPLADRKSVV